MNKVRASVAALIFALVVLCTGGLLWQQGLQKRVAAKYLAKYLKELQPKLPFLIEDYDLDANWTDLKKGKLSRLGLTLKWGDFRIRLSGPMQVDDNKTTREISLHYQPVTLIEPTKVPLNKGDSPPPLTLDLFARVPSNLKELSELRELGIQTHADQWRWPLFGVELTGLNLIVDWRDHVAQLKLDARSLGWTDSKNSDHAINIAAPAISASTPLLLKPFTIGLQSAPTLDIKFSGKSAEFLWDKAYLDLDFKKHTLNTQVVLKHSAAPLELQGAQFSVRSGPAGHQEVLSIQTLVKGPAEYTVQWRTRKLPIPEILKAFSTALPKIFSTIEVKDGILSTTGTAILAPAGIREIHGNLHMTDLTVFYRSAAALLRGLQFRADYSTEHGIENGQLEIPEAWFHHFKTRLRPTDFSLAPGALGKNEMKLALPGGIPLEVTGLPLQIGPVHGVFVRATPKKTGDFQIATSVAMTEVSAENIAHGFCGKKGLPPASVFFQFNPVEITPTEIETTGNLTARLFDGTIKLEDPSLYDLSSAVPETNFNLSWEGIELARLGQWSNFGKMDGTVTGYAEDVVFQSWLPTQFNFKFQLKPHREKKIVFSTDAMRNLVRVISGPESLDSLPSYANWVAFGWPARLFGGYDVDYFGLSAFSTDSVILVETLDPPGTKKTDEHFILHGMRFKIPLKTPRYPLVVDAVFMSNYIHTLMGNLHHVSKANAEVKATAEIKLEETDTKNGPEKDKEKNHAKSKNEPALPAPVTTTKEEDEQCLPPYSLFESGTHR